MGHDGPLRRKLSSVLPGRKRIAALIEADVLIVHTALMMCAAEILLARLMGRRICAIYWDTYPDSFRRPWGNRPAHILAAMGALERFLLRRCDLILPPSTDYMPALERLGVADRVHVLPIWPFTETFPARRERPGTGPVRVVFAGQINLIRGLDHACRVLSNAARHHPVELHVYGDLKGWTPPELDEGFSIVTHGRVPQASVSAALPDFDFGLVSLHPDFDCAVFPSKTASCITAGLPILYVGPELPAYSRFLQDTGVGATITLEETFDLAEASRRYRAHLPAAQQRALEVLRIDPVSIQAMIGTR